MDQFSNPTPDNINQICETFSNLTAGKIITKGNKRFIIHSGKSNLTPAQINTLQSLHTNLILLSSQLTKERPRLSLPDNSMKRRSFANLTTLIITPLLPSRNAPTLHNKDHFNSGPVKAKFHYTVLVADRSEAGSSQVQSWSQTCSELEFSLSSSSLASRSQQVCDQLRTCL